VGAPSKDQRVGFATIPTDVPLPRLIALTRKAGLGKLPLAEAVEALRSHGHREFPTIPAPLSLALTPEQESTLAQLTSTAATGPVCADSLQVSELVHGEQPPPLDWPTLPGEAVSSPSIPFGGEPPSAKSFWLSINAELIVHGVSEPNASVTIGGRPVELQPDGSFSVRFALPDGQYELPVIAISADNADGRTASLRFTRETTCCGSVSEAPQNPDVQPPSPENT
jgi:hypothetical protein